MRGPGTSPVSIARCNVKMEWSRDPTSRTVVKPASKVCRAAWLDLSNVSAGRLFGDRVDDIRFSAKAEMHVTVDQAW